MLLLLILLPHRSFLFSRKHGTSRRLLGRKRKKVADNGNPGDGNKSLVKVVPGSR